MTATPLDNGVIRVLHIASILAMALALVGLLLLGVGFMLAIVRIGTGDEFLFASTVSSVLAVLTGFACILTLVAAQVKDRYRYQPKGLRRLAIAFVSCIPQFWLCAIGYGLAGMGQLPKLCMYGGGFSVVLLVVTIVLLIRTPTQ